MPAVLAALVALFGTTGFLCWTRTCAPGYDAVGDELIVCGAETVGNVDTPVTFTL